MKICSNCNKEFDDEFFSSSIAQIIKNNDTRLLKKYWNIKPSSRFFEKLVSTSVKEFDVFVSYITENHNKKVFSYCSLLFFHKKRVITDDNSNN